jgi:hypothetical protein
MVRSCAASVMPIMSAEIICKKNCRMEGRLLRNPPIVACKAESVRIIFEVNSMIKEIIPAVGLKNRPPNQQILRSIPKKRSRGAHILNLYR